MVKVKLETEKVDSRTFIVGYYCSREGVPLPAALEGTVHLRDDFGNHRWELLEDGSVVPANIIPNTDQINERGTAGGIEKAAAVLVRAIVSAIRSTSTPSQSWEAIDEALRDILK